MSRLDAWREKTGLEYRDGFAQWRHVESDLVGRGADTHEPDVTVIVPTFKRERWLVEAVESVLAQDWDRPVELLIVDNDPQSTRHDRLLEEVPALRDTNYRYYVHRENMGWIGNFDRGMELARAPWLTILNDDDLFDVDFLRTMFADLDADPAIDGLVCRKRSFTTVPDRALSTGSLARRAAYRLLTLHRYGGRPSRRILPRHFFWGPLLGSVVGLICRRSRALEIGGFYREDIWSDTWFYVRFAALFRLDQSRHVLASMRVAENQSMKPEIAKDALHDGHLLRRTLVKREVPKWFMRAAPYITARHLAETREFWGVDIPKAEVERLLDISIPQDRPRLYRTARLLLRSD